MAWNAASMGPRIFIRGVGRLAKYPVVKDLRQRLRAPVALFKSRHRIGSTSHAKLLKCLNFRHASGPGSYGVTSPLASITASRTPGSAQSPR